jgi:hypothetical protein
MQNMQYAECLTIDIEIFMIPIDNYGFVIFIRF